GLSDAVKLAAKRDDVNEVTVYEAAIPWTELQKITHTGPFRFAFKINDRDRDETIGWMNSAAGAGELRGSLFSFSPTSQYTAANLSDWTLLTR
ncbi:MAG: hypothetical protein KY468_12420, partial [Armatimonadetes bacterium]|nr:hypothetical protein [Armatimonadota bacterium]